MTFYIVKRDYDEKGFAFRDKERAERLCMKWDEFYTENYELIETEYVWHSELEAVETLDSLPDLFGILE